MSDIEVPNIDYDTETALTPLTDTLMGGGGADLFVSEANGLVTLNPGDLVDGMGGVDTLRLTTTGGSTQVDGFTLMNTEVFEVRNLADWLEMDLIFSSGIETFWLHNTTGDARFDNIQGAADIVVTGGPNGYEAETQFNFNDSLFQGADDTQRIYVDDANADIEINDYPGAGTLEHIEIVANGGNSTLQLDIEGQDTWTITGDAAMLEIDQENWNNDWGPMEYLSSIDGLGFAGDLYLSADVGNGSGTATVDTTSGDDALYLDSHSSSTVQANTRKGSDYAEIDGAWRVELELGGGADTAYLGYYDDIGSGGVDVDGGGGADYVYIDTDGNLDAHLGKKADDLHIASVGGNANINMARGSDDVTGGTVYGHLDAQLGGGTNTLDLTRVYGNTTVIGKNGVDDVDIGDARGYTTMGLGNGDNVIDVSASSASWYETQSFTTGDGSDTLTYQGNARMRATMGDNNDTVNVTGGVNDTMWMSLGADDDTVNLGYNYLYYYDTIMGEGGNDRINVANLAYVDHGSAFGGTTSVENLGFGNGDGTFNGATTGANNAGIMNYWLSGNLTTNFDLDEMASGMTMTMSDNGGSQNYFRLDLAGSSGTANLVFNLIGSGSVFHDFDLTDVATLNVTSNDVDGVSNIPSLTLGTDSTFTGDADLTTVNLAGSTHINMGAVNAVNLATINGGTATRNINLDLDDVAGVITVTTGGGNDTVQGDDTSTAYDVTTNNGNDVVNTQGMDDTIVTGAGADQVTSGAGIDSIDMGSGNDNANFVAADLTAADTVIGGSHDFNGQDSVTITSGQLIRNDEFFFKWSGIEHLILSGELAGDDLGLGAIADAAGLDELTLGGGNDNVTLLEGFTRDLQVNIVGASSIMVDATGTTNNLTISGLESAYDGNDTLKAGTGTNDELVIQTNSGSAVLGSMVTGFEKITVNDLYDHNAASVTMADENIAAGKTMTFNASDVHHAVTLDASAELDGHLNVTGGTSTNNIMTGTGNDTINTSWSNDTIDAGTGNNIVNAGNGNNVVTTGFGTDSVTSGSGADNITTFDGTDTVNADGADTVSSGSGNDTIATGAGDDSVDAGGSNDTITGGLGADNLTGGSGSDTFVYGELLDSSAAVVDTITDFVSGSDKLDFTGLAPLDTADGMQFAGNGASFGQTQALLIDNDGIADVVFQQDDQVLWVDLNDDGTLNADDLQIHLTGDVSSLASGDILLYTPPAL